MLLSSNRGLPPIIFHYFCFSVIPPAWAGMTVSAISPDFQRKNLAF